MAYGAARHRSRPRIFREKLQRSGADGACSRSCLCSVILFIVSQYAVTLASNERNAGLHLEQLADSLSAIDAQSRSFLQDLEDEGVTQGVIAARSAAAVERMKTEFWKYQEACGIESKILIHRRGHEHSLYVVRRIAAQLLSGQL